MYKILTAAVLFAAAPVAGVTEAFAADKDIRVARAEMKVAREDARNAERLVHRWERAAGSDNTRKMEKQDAALRVLWRKELARLRDLGVPTRAEEPQPRDPDFPRKVLPIAPEHPRMEELRDNLVALRDLQPLFDNGTANAKDMKRKNNLLVAIRDRISLRYVLAQEQLEDAKGG